jgi:hypothetical protein
MLKMCHQKRENFYQVIYVGCSDVMQCHRSELRCVTERLYDCVTVAYSIQLFKLYFSSLSHCITIIHRPIHVVNGSRFALLTVLTE